MNKPFMTKFLFLLTVCTLFLFPHHTAAVEHSWSRAFQQHISTWISTLESKDPQFREWKNADAHVTDLGANSHQWLVSLVKQGKPVGYLVVGEHQQQGNEQTPTFVLLEYGLGEYVLFNDALAPPSGKTRQVYDGFAAYWVEIQNNMTQYIDAKTGERYSSFLKPGPAVMPTVESSQLLQQQQELVQVRKISDQERDPFEEIDWLIEGSNKLEKRTPPQWKKLSKTDHSASLVLTTTLFENELVAPFTIGTVHVWKQDVTYVGVWDQGLRFLPSAYIDKVGYLQ